MNQHLGLRTRRHVIRMAAMTIAGAPLLAGPARAGDLPGPIGNLPIGNLPIGRPPIGRPPRPGQDHPQCVLRGTGIRTPSGERRVEDLRVGDAIVTIDGAQHQIRWIGTSRFPLPGKGRRSGQGLPIRVARSAIADGIPRRDLYLSPDHALYIDGALIPVKYLQNGTSIAAGLPPGADDIVYFHIECDTHQVIFAEGAPVETLLVYEPSVRERFSNFVEHERLYGTDRAAMAPFAPVLRYDGVGAEARALARLWLASVVDVRDPLQVTFDRLAERADAMTPA